MTHECVFFDLGGVVFELQTDQLFQQAAQSTGRSVEEINQVACDPELLLPFELGSITPQAYFKCVKAKLKLPWSYGQFVSTWNSILVEMPGVASLLRRLRKQHRLFAVSNTNILHLDYIKTIFSSASLFDDWIASCEVGCRKPDPQIYQLALTRAGTEKGDIVYIDDLPELVQAGKSFGLESIKFEGVQQLEGSLRSLGLDI